MISIECFEGLPIEYESFLLTKYDSYITTCRYLEIYYSTYKFYHMFVYEDDVLKDLLLFGNNGNTSQCFNALVALDQTVIYECIDRVLGIYPSIKKVIIDASYSRYKLSKSVLLFKSDNYILKLPSTVDEYYSKLGSSTRQTIRNRRVRLMRDYPEAKFVAKFGKEIDLILINKIIQMSIENLKFKGRVSSIDNIYSENIYKYSQHYGFVSYLEIDGVIVSGNISTLLDGGGFGHVTAYDNKFSKYNVGELCSFYAIQTSIEKGLTTFNFLWGESDLKNRFLAKPHLLFSYIVYRAYSVDFFISVFKSKYTYLFEIIKRSKYSKPIRSMIKLYQKRKFQYSYKSKLIENKT